MTVDGDRASVRVSAGMSLPSLLQHPCGACGRPVAWGAHRCPRCGACGTLLTAGPRYVGLKHWLVAIGIIVIPFAAAVWAAGGR